MDDVVRKVTYRLYPTRRQAGVLHRMLRLHQLLYNAALEQRIETWRQRRRSLRFADQCRDLTELRKADPEFAGLNAQSGQVTLKRVDLAFRHFFRRVREGASRAGFPRFRSLDRFHGWGYKTHGDGWRLHAGKGMKHGSLRLSGVGQIKIRGSARTEGKPKTMEIQRKGERWYASVTISCAPLRSSGSQRVGLDWGVETFATVANDDGSSMTIANPRHLMASTKKLRSAQKALSRKRRGSLNRQRARRRVASIHRKVQNQRHDFLHQQSSRLVGHCRLIATETLQIKNLIRSARGTVENPGSNVRQKAGLNRAILDTAPATFLAMLRTKAEEAACAFVEVPVRSVKPSQTCSGCGHRARKTLAQRRHRCVYCGLNIGRDQNAARVMLNWALQRAPGREPAGCGGGGLPPPLKHETPSVAHARLE